MLVVDDSTLDKPYAQKMDLVQRHWSGKHHAVVEGINLSTLLWTDRDCHVPVDYRVYDKVGDALPYLAEQKPSIQQACNEVRHRCLRRALSRGPRRRSKRSPRSRRFRKRATRGTAKPKPRATAQMGGVVIHS